MKFTVKDYKVNKTKIYFKNLNIFFLAIPTATKATGTPLQKQKTLNFKHYKLYNTLTKKVLYNSSYYNYKFIINSLVFIIIPTKNSNINFYSNQLITLLGIKLNNKIYTINSVPTFVNLNYSKDYNNLIKTLKINLEIIKTLYVQ